MADGRFDELIRVAAATPRTFLHFGRNAGDPTLDGSGQGGSEKRPRTIETSALSDCFYARKCAFIHVAAATTVIFLARLLFLPRQVLR